MLVYILLVSCLATLGSTWHQTVQFDFQIDLKDTSLEQIRSFESEYSTRDFFTVLSRHRNNYIDSDSMLIGARNHMYQISLPDLRVLNDYKWTSSVLERANCINRSIVFNKDECDNYIKLSVNVDHELVKVCSTNALNPKCRTIRMSNQSEYSILNETSGLGLIPIRAFDNKYIYNYVDNQRMQSVLFAANALDLNRHFTGISQIVDQNAITTNLDDNNWLNRAEFVDSFVYDNRMFVIFNENEETGMLGEDRVAKKITRIAHVCLNDPGAPLNSLRNIWTTYLKTQLSCVYNPAKSKASRASTDEEYEDGDESANEPLFFFDELKSISSVRTDEHGRSYFYAVFSTLSNRITASAVCMFTLDQIMNSFNGPYSSSAVKKTSSTPLFPPTPPKPRPSHCPNKLTYQHIVFSRKNFVMEQPVVSEAVVTETAAKGRFNSIYTDFDISNRNKSNPIHKDALFIGTDDGKVLTFILQLNRSIIEEQFENKSELVYSEQMDVFEDQTVVKKQTPVSKIISNLKLIKPTFSAFNTTSSRFLILATESKIMSMEYKFCGLKLDRKTCNQDMFPYCVWSEDRMKCSDVYEELELSERRNSSFHGLPSIVRKITSGDLLKAINIGPPSSILSIPYSDSIGSSNIYQLDTNKIVFSLSFGSFFAIFFLCSVVCCLVFYVLVKIVVKKCRGDKSKASRIDKIRLLTEKYLVLLRSRFSDFKQVKKQEKPAGDDSGHASSSYATSSTDFSNPSSNTSSPNSSSSLTKLSSISAINLNQMDPRYVIVEGHQSSISTMPRRFQDYDAAEYYMTRKPANLSFNTNHQRFKTPNYPYPIRGVLNQTRAPPVSQPLNPASLNKFYI